MEFMIHSSLDIYKYYLDWPSLFPATITIARFDYKVNIN